MKAWVLPSSQARYPNEQLANVDRDLLD